MAADRTPGGTGLAPVALAFSIMGVAGLFASLASGGSDGGLVVWWGGGLAAALVGLVLGVLGIRASRQDPRRRIVAGVAVWGAVFGLFLWLVTLMRIIDSLPRT